MLNKQFKLIAKQNGWGNEDFICDFIATLAQQGQKGTTHITHISKKEVKQAIKLGYELIDNQGLETFGEVK